MSKDKQHILTLNAILIDLMKNADAMTAQEISNIKRQARNLYENLVWLQYRAEEVEG